MVPWYPKGDQRDANTETPLSFCKRATISETAIARRGFFIPFYAYKVKNNSREILVPRYTYLLFRYLFMFKIV